MNKEEVEKVLEELNQVDPFHLNDEALRLFNAIMSIADERDLYKNKIEKAIEYIKTAIFNRDEKFGTELLEILEEKEF